MVLSHVQAQVLAEGLIKKLGTALRAGREIRKAKGVKESSQS